MDSTPSSDRLLRAASVLEATTLLLLVAVAVPLKHLAGWPQGVSLVGPLHGVAFLFYLWAVVQALGEGGWSRAEALRLLLVALVPLGGFVNLGWLRRRGSMEALR